MAVNAVTEWPQLLHKTIDLVFFFGFYSNILLVITGAKGIALLRSNIIHVTVGCLDPEPFIVFLKTGFFYRRTFK